MTAAIDGLLADVLADETSVRALLAFRGGASDESGGGSARPAGYDRLVAWADGLCPDGSRELFYYLREYLGREDQAQAQQRAYEVWMQGTPERVLDVGCGIGQTVLALSRRWPARYSALDPNPVACALARLVTRPAGAVEVVTGQAEQLPFSDASFDRIHSRVVIQYTDSFRSLAEMTRCLKPGGRLYVKVTDWRYYSQRVRALLSRPDPRALFLNGFPIVNGWLCRWLGHPVGFRWKGARFQEHYLGRAHLARCERKLGLRPVYDEASARLPTPGYVWEKSV